MIRVKKDGVIYNLDDGNHLSAFLSNGWQIVEEKKAKVEKPEPVEEVKEEKPKPKRRRKKASK